MYEFVTFNINIFLQELWVSHFDWIPETYDAYVALGEQHLWTYR